VMSGEIKIREVFMFCRVEWFWSYSMNENSTFGNG
jgi:hypothetical protein